MISRLLAVIVFWAAFAASAAAQPGMTPIEVRATPVSAFSRTDDTIRFGDLEFRGGLELGSLNRDFGSLSGIDFLADGKTFIAVSDTGFWFSAETDEIGNHLVGISNPRSGAMLLENGKPPPTKIQGDAEGIRLSVANGEITAYVSFEQTPAIRHYRGPDFAAAVPTRMKLPNALRNLRRNQGLEAIAIAPAGSRLAGAVVAIAERSLDKNGNHRAFILTGPERGSFTIPRSSDFDVTDAAFLANGDLVILERRFSFAGGLAIRIRRIAAGDVHAGTLAAPVTLMEADGSQQIDNLEGLAVREMNGETILTLVSDNNGSMFQRTLLLQFALIEDGTDQKLP